LHLFSSCYFSVPHLFFPVSATVERISVPAAGRSRRGAELNLFTMSKSGAAEALPAAVYVQDGLRARFAQRSMNDRSRPLADIRTGISHQLSCWNRPAATVVHKS
jgi:hypothetical protein